MTSGMLACDSSESRRALRVRGAFHGGVRNRGFLQAGIFFSPTAAGGQGPKRLVLYDLFRGADRRYSAA